MTDTFLVFPLPDGECGAFTVQQLNEARARAAEMGFRAAVASVSAPASAESLVDSKAMAKVLACNDTLVEQLARDGRLPSIRIGKLLRFEPTACIAALKVSPK